MKLKNVKVGDLVEAKRDIKMFRIFSDDINIKSGTIGEVEQVEGVNYSGDLSIKVKFDGDDLWVDPDNFRKVRPKLAVGDKFVVVSSETQNVPVGSKHTVDILSGDKRARLDSMFSVTANKDGSFELQGIGVFLEKVRKTEEPKLEKLDHSIFDGLDKEWQYAAVDKNGSAWVYNDKPFIRYENQWMQHGATPNKVKRMMDATNWQDSLIKREAEVELTGSDLTRKLLEDGQEGILCYVDDHNDEDAVREGLIRITLGFENGWFRTVGASWRYAVPVSDSVEASSRWTHRSGKVYTVDGVANTESRDQGKLPMTVVYRDEEDKLWSRPLTSWYSSMTKIKE